MDKPAYIYVVASVICIFVWIWKKDWGIGLFAGYLFLVFAETVLIRSSGELRYEMMPLWSWKEAFKKWPLTNGGRIIVQQVILNIVMFIPIGIIMGQKLSWKVIPIGFIISLVIETIQLISHKGLFEIDDILFTTQ